MDLATTLADHYHHDDGWWWAFGTLRLLLVGLIVFLIVRFVVMRRRHRGVYGGPPWHHLHGGVPTAHHVLAERYAKGEIDAGEYRERLATLNEEPPKKST